MKLEGTYSLCILVLDMVGCRLVSYHVAAYSVVLGDHWQVVVILRCHTLINVVVRLRDVG